MTYEQILQVVDLKPHDVPMIVLGAVLVFLFIRLLKVALFDRYLALIEARERATGGNEHLASDLLKKSLELQSQYEMKLQDVRVQALQQKLAKIETAKRDAAATVEAAEDDAQERLRNVRWQLKEQEGAVRSRLQGDADVLAQQIVQKVLQ